MQKPLREKLFLATTNRGKAAELTARLQPFFERCLTLSDLTDPPAAPAETGESFTRNARIKAEFWCAHTGLPTLADDSGIFITALSGELGVATRRWGAGEQASDEQWLEYFLNRLAVESDRSAEFRCVLAFAIPGRLTEFFAGQVNGQITQQIAAPIKTGIPLSSVFLPDGGSQVFAALTDAEKNQFSHRGRALEKFVNFLAANPSAQLGQS